MHCTLVITVCNITYTYLSTSFSEGLISIARPFSSKSQISESIFASPVTLLEPATPFKSASYAIEVNALTLYNNVEIRLRYVYNFYHNFCRVFLKIVGTPTSIYLYFFTNWMSCPSDLN